MALAFRQIIDISANVSIWFVSSVVVITFFLFSFFRLVEVETPKHWG